VQDELSQHFFTEFAAFLLSAAQPRTLAQGLPFFVASLSMMDSCVQLVWLAWVAQAAAKNQNPYNITENAFRNLVTDAVRSPNNIMDAKQCFQALICSLCNDIPVFIVTFQNALSCLPRWVLLFLMVPFWLLSLSAACCCSCSDGCQEPPNYCTCYH
jgi:hypothetical protein